MSDRKLVMIVEDDEDIQDIYKEMLFGRYDIDLKQCFNGKEGREAVRERKPDLVFLDLLMPVMNGEEFLRVFRHELGIKEVPVVICSVNQSLARRLLDAGEASAVMPKLFTEKDLSAVISQFLNLEIH